VLWFLMIRPQMKRAKEHKALLEGLQKNDEVLTGGGIVGKVVAISDAYVTVEVADQHPDRCPEAGYRRRSAQGHAQVNLSGAQPVHTHRFLWPPGLYLILPARP
jgi:hypothetical protein